MKTKVQTRVNQVVSLNMILVIVISIETVTVTRTGERLVMEKKSFLILARRSC